MTMKTGKISQTAWRRSVGKQFHMRRPGEVSQLTKESAGGALVSPDKEGMVWAEASAYGRAGRTGFYAVLEAAGNVAAKRRLTRPGSPQGSFSRWERRRRRFGS